MRKYLLLLLFIYCSLCLSAQQILPPNCDEQSVSVITTITGATNSIFSIRGYALNVYPRGTSGTPLTADGNTSTIYAGIGNGEDFGVTNVIAEIRYMHEGVEIIPVFNRSFTKVSITKNMTTIASALYDPNVTNKYLFGVTHCIRWKGIDEAGDTIESCPWHYFTTIFAPPLLNENPGCVCTTPNGGTTATPAFEVSYDRAVQNFTIELNTAADFTGTSITQLYNTSYAMNANPVLEFPTTNLTNGTTYYVRIKTLPDYSKCYYEDNAANQAETLKETFWSWDNNGTSRYTHVSCANYINTQVFSFTYNASLPVFVPVSSIGGVATTATVGTPLTLSGTVAPSNATNQTIAWSIKNAGSTGASISEGNKLNASAPGSVKVTATITCGLLGTAYTQDFEITVCQPVSNISGVATTATVGSPLSLSGTVAPSNATNQTIAWSIKNVGTTGASLTGATLSTTAAGTVVVTATIANGLCGTAYTQDFDITVVAPCQPVSNISGVATTATVGSPLSLSGTVSPSNATNQTIAWSIKNAGTTGASITGNTLNTTAAGTVVVTASIANGSCSAAYTQDFTITVSEPAQAAAPVFHDYGCETHQLVFNHSAILDQTKMAFRVSCADAVSAYIIKIYSDPAYTTEVYSETFTGNVAASTAVSLACDFAANKTSDLIVGKTYFARVGAVSGANTTWSQGIHAFTFKSCVKVEWYQHINEQFEISYDAIDNIEFQTVGDEHFISLGTTDELLLSGNITTKPIYLASFKGAESWGTLFWKHELNDGEIIVNVQNLSGTSLSSFSTNNVTIGEGGNVSVDISTLSEAAIKLHIVINRKTGGKGDNPSPIIYHLGLTDGENPTPVTWLSFDGTCEDNNTQLSWSTASEQNSESFVVQRSTNMSAFEEIGRVAAAGNSVSRIDYNFVDVNVYSDMYYRLKQVDFDGSFDYSKTIYVKCSDDDSDIQIYPNPSSGKIFYVTSNAELQNVSLTLYDISGRIVHSEQIANITDDHKVTLKNKLMPGTYYLQVQSENNTIIKNKKLVIN